MPTISPREREVLLAVADRLTNAEIAERLYVSVRTVESHVSALLRKLDARDRRELATRAPVSAAAPGPVVGAPRPLTSFVGRTAERDAVVRLVAESRVTTILGPGGAGKTRLAVVATEAAGFPATFVNLVPSRPGSVLESVAAGLGVVPRPQQPLADAVAGALTGRALLVLDNCEHVADDVAAVITALTAANPELSVLTTSRERLGVPGETVLQLGPLAGDAVTLFTDRAKAVDPAFDADPAQVAELCRALGGSPLTIELAAARVASLGIDGLRAGLADDPLRVLAAGRGEARHRSLRSVLEWSHRLLTEEEKTVLARVSRFRHGFDLDGVAALSPDLSVGAVSDVLGRLVDKSLVTAASGRWTLADGVAGFAREQLDEVVTERYREWAARRARELVGRLGGDWRDEFDRLADDLRACAGADHDLAVDLARLAYARGFVAEAAVHWRTAANSAPTAAVAAEDLARAGSCAHLLSHARDHYEVLLEAAERAAGDSASRATCLASAVVLAERFRGAGFITDPVPDADLDRMLAEATALAAGHPGAQAHVAVANAWRSGPGPQTVTIEAADLAVAAAARDPLLLSAALDARCTAQALARRPDLAHRTTRERLDLVTAADRTDPRAALEVLDAFRSAITYAIATGALADAARVSRRAAGDPALAGHPYWGAGGLVTTLALTGRFAEARELAERMWQATDGTPRNATLGVPLLAAALAAGLSGDESDGNRWRTRAAAVAGVATPAGSANLAPLDAFVRARVALHTGTGLADVFPDVSADFAPGRFDGYAAGLAAELAVVLDRPDADRHLVRAERHAEHNRWTAAVLTRARARRTGDAGLFEEAANQFAALGAEFEAKASVSPTGTSYPR
ncbi:Predicted ATPase [Amycolatopsis pretoriensis]|uniref:Predicted ATPase n=1 Tax=Amycolatopsis pretoriensis TaxID=218821 RepID=A0A1H5QFB4_9PSEU|nr:LuxR C-terminal-related transcriptional regulator [Amycolatopsis pretoriensis]SEF23917.1 Predicted ATPase [Amycolatopsis pretoriensis]